MITALVSTSPISTSAYGALVASDAFGAVVTFSGNVRNIDQDKEVISLTYEIHPSAQEVLLAIVTEVADKYDLGNVAVVHRYGAIEIGESAFVVAVSAVLSLLIKLKHDCLFGNIKSSPMAVTNGSIAHDYSYRFIWAQA